MTTPIPTSVALLGGPESGKTTYLGALADALQSAAAGPLTLARSAADARGFRRLMDPLLRGEYPQRTKEERHRFVAELNAKTPNGSQERLTLDVGDYDGEEVERLFTRQGELTEEWRARANAKGVLLFLRHDATTPLPRDARPAPSEMDRWAAVKGRSGEQPQVPKLADDPMARFGYGISSDDLAPLPPQPRDRVKVPTTLALIEVLQFLRFVRGIEPAERPPAGDMRVGVLLSAWDAVDPTFQSLGPSRYLAQELPLLHQFLWSNYREEDFCCFGLSSTGGDLRKEDHKKKYMEEPESRVYWSDAGNRAESTKNLALPILWALFGDRALPLAD